VESGIGNAKARRHGKLFNVILFASPGKEDFYRKLGLRKMKTGMALFKKPDEMKEKGFTE